MRDWGLAVTSIDNEIVLIMEHTIDSLSLLLISKELFAISCMQRKFLSWKCAEMVTRILKGELIRQKDVSP